MKRTALFLCLAAGLAAAQEPEAGKVFAVRTARPQRRTIAQTLVKTGSLAAPARVALCAKVPGRLASTALDDGTAVEEGTRAEKGDALARLDDREYRIARDSAKAAAEAARALAEDAAREFARTERLRASGVATEQEFDVARFARDRTAASLAQAEGGLAKAELDLEECVVRAPFDGVVAAKRLHPGAMVSASSEIFEFVATDPLHALFEVPTTALPLLKPGETKVRVTVDAYPDEPEDLVVAEAYPAADPATRTVTAKALLPNPGGRFRPGMYATGAFALDERAGVLVVPFEAVLRIRDRRCVYKVEGGRAVLADVATGLRHDDGLEIVSGLSDGDEIVVDGLHRLADGVPVRVVE
ncbi:MAG: efflux RND transporter periplasmic adaptor subunit [Kiritimatiellae bacterium]|nr:efflux RND transporter periplasmic adaptor subunit [Kiritimatiellia bacterium]